MGLAWVVLVFRSDWIGRAGQFLREHHIPGEFQVPYLLYSPGLVFVYFGYRLCLRIFDPSKHFDPRPPVVYLRAFDDDRRGTFQPSGLIAAIHGIEAFGGAGNRSVFGLPWSTPFWLIHPVKLSHMFFNRDQYTAEEILARAFTACGPFVAVGRPGERFATPGADRMYVTNEDWQRVVLDYLDRCRAVVLQPSGSEGVRWEVGQVFERIPLHRILLSLVYFRQRVKG
jgi:hypothetical protein